MNFKEFYLREHTQALYHATFISNLYKMIKDNAIKLTYSTGADSSINRNKYYYLSAMTVKYGKYADTGMRMKKGIGHDVVLDLNGDAISRVAKIRNVDYWGKMNDEQEERIMMDKPQLSPFSKYVNSIHIYVGSDSSDVIINMLFFINDKAEKLGIDVYFYGEGNETAFKMQRIERATTDVSDLIQKPENVDLEEYKLVIKYDDGKIELYPRGQRTLSKKDAEEMFPYFDEEERIDSVEIKNVSEIDELSYNFAEKNIIDLLNVLNEKPLDFHREIDFRSELLGFDAKSSILADIHNLKRQHSPVLDAFVNNMKKYKFRNDSKFIDFILDKNREYYKKNM